MKLFIYIWWVIHEYMYLPVIDIKNLKMHFLSWSNYQDRLGAEEKNWLRPGKAIS